MFGRSLSIGIALYLCSMVVVNGQIVNIESRRLSLDSANVIGEFELNGSIAMNPNSIVSIGFNSRIGYRLDRFRYLGIAKFDGLWIDGRGFSNRWFFHFRSSYEVKKWFELEGFLQLQSDEIRFLYFRGLHAFGTRFHFAYRYVDVGIGIMGMLEVEQDLGIEDFHLDGRFSSYCNLVLNFTRGINYSSILYYQPMIINFKDFRIVYEGRFNLASFKRFKAGFSFGIYFDSNPPVALKINRFFSFSWQPFIGVRF